MKAAIFGKPVVYVAFLVIGVVMIAWATRTAPTQPKRGQTPLDQCVATLRAIGLNFRGKAASAWEDSELRLDNSYIFPVPGTTSKPQRAHSHR